MLHPFLYYFVTFISLFLFNFIHVLEVYTTYRKMNNLLKNKYKKLNLLNLNKCYCDYGHCQYIKRTVGIKSLITAVCIIIYRITDKSFGLLGEKNSSEIRES